ncbi:RagB/SusD family nutrient uptake outer membrane protein [Chitinophaga sp. MM2321]|uniref:RagB/SusD family nutrient uptake outer membrane protein n=1 Tax=Chitinophaga sp. MM2321 TaxID=3137178 RepID=UPI0032D58FF0
MKEDIYTQYDPASFTNTVDGFEKVLNGAYSQLQVRDYAARNDMYCFGEFCTDEMLETGGGFEAQAKDFINFTWNATNDFFNTSWTKSYAAVRDANVILDNKDNNSGIPADKLKGFVAEARFIRAAAYSYMYNFFGPVPLITSTKNVNAEQARATDDEIKKFIIDELTAAAQDLPVTQAIRGRATKGAALAVLTKFYLNTRQWQESADAAKQIIDLSAYSLFPDISRLFAVENENNAEYIYTFPCINQSGYGNIVMAHTFPASYPIQTNWIIFGAQFKLYTSFVDTFEPADKRFKMILTEYTDTKGTHHEMVRDATGKSLDNARSFKFVPDPNGLSADMGNDIPVIRYADILLSRAEALNELNGATIASIDLINEVRNRAGVADIKLAAYPSKEKLRDFILEERGREFFAEGKRREDLIRMGKFISGAKARGVNAKDYHVLYPIPQREIDADKNLAQNGEY